MFHGTPIYPALCPLCPSFSANFLVPLTSKDRSHFQQTSPTPPLEVGERAPRANRKKPPSPHLPRLTRMARKGQKHHGWGFLLPSRTVSHRSLAHLDRAVEGNPDRLGVQESVCGGGFLLFLTVSIRACCAPFGRKGLGDADYLLHSEDCDIPAVFTRPFRERSGRAAWIR